MVIYLFTLFIFIFNNLFYKNKLINLEERKEEEELYNTHIMWFYKQKLYWSWRPPTFVKIRGVSRIKVTGMLVVSS